MRLRSDDCVFLDRRRKRAPGRKGQSLAALLTAALPCKQSVKIDPMNKTLREIQDDGQQESEICE